MIVSGSVGALKRNYCSCVFLGLVGGSSGSGAMLQRDIRDVIVGQKRKW